MTLTITIISDAESWINDQLPELIHEFKSKNYSVKIIHNLSDITQGDVLFILSFSKIIPEKYLRLNTSNIVVHASKLPKGKGWSPASWQI